MNPAANESPHPYASFGSPGSGVASQRPSDSPHHRPPASPSVATSRRARLSARSAHAVSSSSWALKMIASSSASALARPRLGLGLGFGEDVACPGRRGQDPCAPGLREGAGVAGGEVHAGGAFEPLPVQFVLAQWRESIADRDDRALAGVLEQRERAAGGLLGAPGHVERDPAAAQLLRGRFSVRVASERA